MGRRAKPVGLHIAQGNPNRLTKAEIERRKEAEIKLGDTVLNYSKVDCPTYVKEDLVAYDKWQELLREYRKAAKDGTELIKTSDLGVLARYCKTHSEYQGLLRHRAVVGNIELTPEEVAEAENVLEDQYGKKMANNLFKKINYLLSVGGILSIDTAINKKADMLIKLEDRLFLNPLAKVKNVPKKQEKQKSDPLKERGFGNV